MQQILPAPTFTANHQEAPEVHRLETRAYKNMSTKHSLYNATSIIHNAYYFEQITRKFKTSSSPLWFMQSNAERNST